MIRTVTVDSFNRTGSNSKVEDDASSRPNDRDSMEIVHPVRTRRVDRVFGAGARPMYGTGATFVATPAASHSRSASLCDSHDDIHRPLRVHFALRTFDGRHLHGHA
jgi:hypothetical protein